MTTPPVQVLPPRLVIASLPPDAAIPPLDPAAFSLLIRDEAETTVVLEEGAWGVLAGRYAAPRAEGGYRALRLVQDFPLDTVGVMAAAAGRLAGAGVPLMAYSTFRTDVLLVRERDLDQALAALDGASF
ncbi:MAG TPA: ACT domain-containing protein [Deinococcales bacterium]|nr:ACT domain-containing protein [Deinococcales bacterium]